MDLFELAKYGTESIASDIHITVGVPIVFRINGILLSLDDYELTPEDTKSLVYQALGDSLMEELENKGEVDTSYSNPEIGRYRISAFKQKGSYGMVLRIIPLKIPSMDELGL